MRWLALLPFFFAGPALADQDTWDNEYPTECSVEALDEVYIRVFYRPASFFLKATHVDARVGVLTPTGVAVLRDDLVEGSALWLDTVRHEKCHKIAGEWHGHGTQKADRRD